MQAVIRTHLPFTGKLQGGRTWREGPGVMSGAMASTMESGGQEQTGKQSLEAGLLSPELQTSTRGRCQRCGLGIWVWP